MHGWVGAACRCTLQALQLPRSCECRSGFNWSPCLCLPCRMLAAAGCPLNGAGSVAGLLNLHLLPSFPVSTFSCWLAFRPTQGGLWPQPLSSGDLGVAEALLECSASQGYSIQARDFYCAACRGDKRLMRALLAAFPQCLQQLQCTIFSSGSSYRTSLSTIFVRRLRRLPVPKEVRDPNSVLLVCTYALLLHVCLWLLLRH